jgi:beta-glucosidase
MREFPKNFFWGASTSSHQIEGGNINDWSQWEAQSADRLAKESELKFSHLASWPQIRGEAMNSSNYISGQACDHYNRFEEDLEIARILNHNAFRFSIEWSRIEPRRGEFDEKEINHYVRVVDSLREKGMEPFVTLWHWTIPLWARDQGGWGNSRIIDDFSRFAQKISQSLAGKVKYWIILNEPEVYAGNSYLKGFWPPQKRNVFAYSKAFNNLAKAHKKVFDLIKKSDPEVQIGVAKHNIYFEAYQNRFGNRLMKRVIDWWWNFRFLDKIKDKLDFIGLNYYSHNLIDEGFGKNRNREVSDMGWELYPEGIYQVLKELNKYGKPIIITENGLADFNDEHRGWFILETLKNILKAIDKGIDVRGYLHWSLLDNFEWDKGFWPRFGLVEVDYKTMERKIRPSARLYARICKENGLAD